MASSIIGDTAAASGKPAPRLVRLPVLRKPAIQFHRDAIDLERGHGRFQIGLCHDADGVSRRALAQTAAKDVCHLLQRVRR